jgi:glucose-6-phosphate dehydrogenase assembly protein OpcA
MTIFSEFGPLRSRRALVNANLMNTQAFALEQLVSIHCVTTDLRWAMVELAWRSLTAMCAFAQGRLLSWVRSHRTPREEEGGGHCCC